MTGRCVGSGPMGVEYRIHPSIGVARVGNSPEWFLGPELVGERPDPPDGFKDDLCRVKRQAARFRVFAHHDDGTASEVTDLDHDIAWSVHVVNAKAAHPMRGNAGDVAALTIDPGRKVVDGPARRVPLSGGRITFAGQPTVHVSLGELRTDGASRLYVLGGTGMAGSPANQGLASYWGNPGWWDDASDGPVRARVRPKGSTGWRRAAPAWVVVAPPKFAPHQDSPTTLYDRLLQVMVDARLLPVPTTTSYTRDVHPILQRARDVNSVRGLASPHADPATWDEPVIDPGARAHVHGRVTPPDGPPSGGMRRCSSPTVVSRRSSTRTSSVGVTATSSTTGTDRRGCAGR